MNFGPLNRPGGERRLNVLISRARRRCEVFTSLSADDIDTSRTPSKGMAALKTFLRYAQTEQIETAAASDRPPDSDFEEQVARELVAMAYTVHTQVGCAGFFIDLAIVDPNEPGRYVLGIECDGASYHSARSARDRDRLRQYVLEGLGWRIHRVWSTDWFNNPESELRKVLQAIQTAQTVSGPPLPPPPAPTPAEPEAETVTLPPAPMLTAARYESASVALRLDAVPMHEVDRSQLAELLARVVAVESPVHWNEAARRFQRGLQQRHKTQRRIARHLVRSLQRRQLGQCPAAPVCQFGLHLTADGAGFERELQPGPGLLPGSGPGLRRQLRACLGYSCQHIVRFHMEHVTGAPRQGLAHQQYLTAGIDAGQQAARV